MEGYLGSSSHMSWARDEVFGELNHPLKGPKLEIFVAGIFAQIRPIWIGDLGTRPKNPKKLCLGP